MRTTGEEKLGVNGLALHENGQDEVFPKGCRHVVPILQMNETSPIFAEMQELLARFVCNALALFVGETDFATNFYPCRPVWCQVKIECFCACSSSHSLVSDH